MCGQRVGIAAFTGELHEAIMDDRRFRFDYFLKSRSVLELARRVTSMVRLLQVQDGATPQKRKVCRRASLSRLASRAARPN